MSKKTLSILIAMLLIISLLPMAVAAPGDAASDKKLNVYFVSWADSALRQNQQVTDLPWDRLSTINHAFWKIEPNSDHTEFPIVSADAAADEKWFTQYIEMTAKHPDVKVVLSIGGWTDTKWFAEMASTQAGRASFVNSCVDTLKANTFLGGIDLDWEYPGTARNSEGEGFIGSAADKENFTALLKELRGAMDAAGMNSKIITFCASTNRPMHENGTLTIDYAAVVQYVDRINVMTYDMATAGTNQAIHHSALKPGPHVREGVSVSDIVDYLLGLGIEPGKINIGSPLYSHGWYVPSTVTEGTPEEIAAGALSQMAARSGDGSIGSGQHLWRELKSMEIADGWVAGYDEVSEAAYLYNVNPESLRYQHFYTYENERSLQAKIDYINEKGLGGFIVWDTTGDEKSSFPMLTQMAKGLGLYDGEIPEFKPAPFEEPNIPQANPVGFWSDSVQWNVGDIAVYEGIVAKCIAKTTLNGGETPSEATSWGWGRWEKLGNEADLLSFAEPPVFDREVSYPAGSLVTLNGAVFKALFTTHGLETGWGESPEDPDMGWGYWELYAGEMQVAEAPAVVMANSVGYWNADVQWNPGDLAIYEGMVYRNIVATHPGEGAEYPGTNWGYWEGPEWNNEQPVCTEAELLAGEFDIPVFARDITYVEGALAQFDGMIYRAVHTTHGAETGWGESPEDPDLGWGYWAEVAASASQPAPKTEEVAPAVENPKTADNGLFIFALAAFVLAACGAGFTIKRRYNN